MFLGFIATKAFKLKGKMKVFAEIVVGALEMGLMVTLGWAIYPAEAIALQAMTLSAQTICAKKLSQLWKTMPLAIKNS